jgi:hypothetical protein
MTDHICCSLGTSRGVTFFTPKIGTPQVKQYIKRFCITLSNVSFTLRTNLFKEKLHIQFNSFSDAAILHLCCFNYLHKQQNKVAESPFDNKVLSFINTQKSQKISLTLRNIGLKFISSIHAKNHKNIFYFIKERL